MSLFASAPWAKPRPSWQIVTGDNRLVLATLPDACIDAIVTDPPYGMSCPPDMFEVLRHWLAGDDYQHTGGGFMGKTWDSFVPGPTTWRHVLRVLKPGGHLLAFFAPRTYDLGVLAIRMAGFEIRDQLAYMFGTGFPKGKEIGRAIDMELCVLTGRHYDKTLPKGEKAKPGDHLCPEHPDGDPWRGHDVALKPAHEPIVLARKPLIGTVAANVLAHGTGGINVDACRVAADAQYLAAPGNSARAPMAVTSYAAADHGDEKAIRADPNAGGRWPANVLLDEISAAALDEQSGTVPGQQGRAKTDGSEQTRTIYSGGRNYRSGDPEPRGDTGGASRFFFHAHEDDREWLDRNQILDLASTATGSLCLRSEPAASALARAVTSALPGISLRLSSAPSTNVTPSESRLIVEIAITTILNIGERFWLVSPPASTISTHSRATCAVKRTPTGTTTITIEHWRSDGSADPVTFESTSPSSAHGAPACRFSYTAKASKSEREAGLDHLPVRSGGELTDRTDGSDGLNSPRAGAGRGGGRRNHHPCVKPIALMRYLVRLITPPGGIVLDPFAGSGSTIAAAVLEGFNGLGLELDQEYANIARARVAHWEKTL